MGNIGEDQQGGRIDNDNSLQVDLEDKVAVITGDIGVLRSCWIDSLATVFNLTE
ncbi:MAG TPA: hypothetical protein GXX70_02245 [Tepidimicrobium sp.]|nr:hypothetical protein [Tepidimicrobium sp.]